MYLEARTIVDAAMYWLGIATFILCILLYEFNNNNNK